MLLRIEDLKDVCSTILPAVDSTVLSVLTDTLQLVAKNGVLTLNVTNKEYFVSVKLSVDSNEDFNATVNANVFLKLVSQTTSEVIELSVNKTNLLFKGNGDYKLPLIYEGDKLLELPVIVINNITVDFDIASDILTGILNNNSRQIAVGTISSPVQKLYYIDDKGAITFTSGACSNSFTLAKPVQILLNQRVVKLFKLFKDGDVHFTLGQDVDNQLTQTKVKFENNKICITAIISNNDGMISSVPVQAIRNRADKDYPYHVVLSKNELIETISRIKLFAPVVGTSLFGKFVFKSTQVVVSDTNGENKESILYESAVDSIKEDYTMYLDLNELGIILDTCFESYLTFKFGDSQAIVLSRGSVSNVIPEVNFETE